MGEGAMGGWCCHLRRHGWLVLALLGQPLLLQPLLAANFRRATSAARVQLLHEGLAAAVKRTTCGVRQVGTARQEHSCPSRQGKARRRGHVLSKSVGRETRALRLEP